MGVEIFFAEARGLARATQRHIQSTLGQGDITAAAFAVALHDNVSLYEDYDQSAASIFNEFAQGRTSAAVPLCRAGE